MNPYEPPQGEIKPPKQPPLKREGKVYAIGLVAAGFVIILLMFWYPLWPPPLFGVLMSAVCFYAGFRGLWEHRKTKG